MRLARSLDELRGLRAARWVRESTKAQHDRYGPDAQREQQDRAIERYELVDAGISWMVAHSGRTIAGTPEFAAMRASAGIEYDVLLVGYVSRFARDLRTAVNARHDLHESGASILFCDERVLSSDEDAWESWARETIEAEAYSRRLSRRIREGLAAKVRRERDQGSGETSYGFRRVNGLLEPDPDTMPTVVEAYQLAADGLADNAVAAATGLTLWQVRTVMRSSLYSGRLADGRETRFPAPVPLELVEAAAAARSRRQTSGHRKRHRVYPLTDRGPLVCDACDRPLIGVTRTGQSRAYRHPQRCEAWAQQEHLAAPYEEMVQHLLDKAKPNLETAARVRAALRRPTVEPDRLALARLDAEMRRLALSLIENPDRSVMDRLDQLRQQRSSVEESPIVADQPDADDALDYLNDLGRVWRDTSDDGRRNLAVATFARLGAIGPRIVSLEATPFAERRGIVLALPTKVSVVGGTGLHARALTWPISIEHRSDWLRAVRSA